MEKILIVDGMNFIHRANFSFGKPSEKSSEYVTIYNFFRNLRASVDQFSPNRIFFVLEGHPKFRYDLYSEYKANRLIKTAEKQASKDKIFSDAKVIIDLLHHLPITTCKAEHYEADDVVSALVDNLKDEQVIVLSNDTDYIQILQRGYASVGLYNPMKKEFRTAPEYNYVKWKALNGDKTDNIKSLLTPKKALDTVNNPDRFKAFLEVPENHDNFAINKKLIEFADVPLDEIIMIPGEHDYDYLLAEFCLMEFDTMVERSYWNKFTNTFARISL